MKVRDISNVERDIYGIMVKLDYVKCGDSEKLFFSICAYDYNNTFPAILKMYYPFDNGAWETVGVCKQAEKLDKICDDFNKCKHEIFDSSDQPGQALKKEELMKRQALLSGEFEKVLKMEPEKSLSPEQSSLKPTRRSKGRR